MPSTGRQAGVPNVLVSERSRKSENIMGICILILFRVLVPTEIRIQSKGISKGAQVRTRLFESERVNIWSHVSVGNPTSGDTCCDWAGEKPSQGAEEVMEETGNRRGPWDSRNCRVHALTSFLWTPERGHTFFPWVKPF